MEKEIKEIKKEIRHNLYSTPGLAIVTTLGLIGLFLCLFSLYPAYQDINNLYNCIAANGMVIIFGAFFVLISLYCWLSFILNIVVNPKKEILYLLKSDNYTATFINKKGKTFNTDNKNLSINKYYNVLKTKDYIYMVLDEYHDQSLNWSLEEKESYWLNYYSPLGNFEGLLLLPIVYVILIPFVLSAIMAKGLDRLPGIILSLFPLYAIGYDAIYKIKKKKSPTKEVDDSKMVESYEIIIKLIAVIASSIMSIILSFIMFKLEGGIERLIFIPFLLISLCSTGITICKLMNNESLENFFGKACIIIFILFWFGFIICFAIGMYNQEHNFTFIIYLMPFIAAGIYMVYNFLIKKQ